MSEPKPIWVIMPAMANPQMTEDALSDCLAQSVPVRVLLVLQGVDESFRARMLAIAEQEPRLSVWHHDPPLPSLSATWNRALQFVWEVGGAEALVVNNDVRIHPDTVKWLHIKLAEEKALFVSAVGVTANQYDPTCNLCDAIEAKDQGDFRKGGPDFSCFLISREGHEKYPFDEAIIPSFTEDLDMHRRYMLGGDGERIFSINLPFHHIGGGSQTLKSFSPEKRAAFEQRISGARAYYQRKWGGEGVNRERFTIPFEPKSDQDGVTTPELQRAIQSAET